MNTSSRNLVKAYEDNMLIDACGPILNDIELAKHLSCLPPIEKNAGAIDWHIRRHCLYDLRHLHVPMRVGVQTAQTIDLMLRQGYVHRNPKHVTTWRKIYGDAGKASTSFSPPLAAAAIGIPGVGKSAAIVQALRYYPPVVIHEKFPTMAAPFQQVVWLKIDAPYSGKSIDLAAKLMEALDDALGTNHFSEVMCGTRKRGPEMLRIWLQKALSHFLGILVIDEFQNLFKSFSIKERRALRNKEGARPEMRIVEDETLKFLLTLTNTAGIPLVISSTPDGMAAFSTRASTAQRLLTGGFHKFTHFESPEDPFYKNYLFPKLCQYQWFEEKLPANEKLRSYLHDLTGGVPRILSCLWFAAQRCAFERKAKALTFDDIQYAADTLMQGIKPAVEALKSNDIRKLSMYEDLVPRNDAFWDYQAPLSKFDQA